jgi:uncharacterized 2Fe-2S/4Fe-4S cluster protein (DUF4445 family)
MKKNRNEKPKKKKRSVGPPPVKKHKPKYVWLNVLPDDLWLKVRRGRTIWEVLRNTEIDLEGDCGGLGKCGKCKVKVLSSIGSPSEEARELLDEEELKEGIRLACRTKISKDLVIRVGEPEAHEEYFQILKTGYQPLIELNPLMDKRIVTLTPQLLEEEISDLDRIKRVMAPEYQELIPSLYCLRSLPGVLKKTEFHGAAVFHENELLAWQDWEEVGRRYGLVFDLGTSTLVGRLISLLHGNEVTVVSRLNSQIKYGSDVISRLQYVRDHPAGLHRLHHLLIRDLNRITKRLLEVGGLGPNDIFVAVAGGNTTMQHFLLGLDPYGIAEAPFSPVVTDGLVVKASNVGLTLHPEALLYVMPAKAGYIGGDLISVVLASGAAEQEDKIVLGLDLGTNGEIFLGNKKRLLTCSAAAGPALEGAKISQGMIAKTGAIEGVFFEDGHLRYQVIGNIKPKGICGSGLVDLVAVLLHCDVIDSEGLICPPKERALGHLCSRTLDRSGVHDFLVASAEESYDHRPVYLTQKDVRELQLAKGAVAAGIKTLMDEMGIKTKDISQVYLAGALGNYINLYSAMRIGLLPMVNPEVIKSLGNAASTGASMVLLSRKYWDRAIEVAQFIEHIELSLHPGFNEYFIEHLDFPTENLW